jgi:hypothetical protein
MWISFQQSEPEQGDRRMTREIGPELVARLRRFADSLEAIARGEVDSPQPFIAAYAVYLNGEYDSSYGPDAIDEALEIAAECSGDVVPLYRTPQTHATPGEGSVHGGSSTPKSYETSDEKRVVCDMKQKPVAWARFFHNGCPQSVYLDRPPADAVPLYRWPTLTDEEREALAGAIASEYGRGAFAWAATLKGLLERLG